MHDLILFGMQGSGKGTQAQALASRFGYQIFETGGAFRRMAASDTPLGQQVKSIIESGNLVPNEITMQVVADFLRELPTGEHVLFDGIPRFEEQRATFETELANVGRHPLALYIRIDEDEALHRLSGRVTCGNCGAIFGTADKLTIADACPKCDQHTLKIRADDTEEAIRRRLDLYARETLPVIESYRAAGRLVEIDGSQPTSEVTSAIITALESR